MANKTFAQFGLKDEILQAIELLHYKQPTPVQTMLIEAMLAGKDVAVQAQTGSGKTAAFAIPICDMLDWNENRPQALILAPTRELALQIKEDVFNVGRFKRIKVSAIFGKSPYNACRGGNPGTRDGPP
jgi:ATP-dependent RNA helicase DeaD